MRASPRSQRRADNNERRLWIILKDGEHPKMQSLGLTSDSCCTVQNPMGSFLCRRMYPGLCSEYSGSCFRYVYEGAESAYHRTFMPGRRLDPVISDTTRRFEECDLSESRQAGSDRSLIEVWCLPRAHILVNNGTYSYSIRMRAHDVFDSRS